MIELIDLAFVKRIIKRKSVHCFELTSPLDRMSKLPFSLFGSSYETLSGKRQMVKSNSENESLVNPFIKRLKLEERYLEDFIKEML